MAIRKLLCQRSSREAQPLPEEDSEGQLPDTTRPPNWPLYLTLPKRFPQPPPAAVWARRGSKPALPKVRREAIASPGQGLRLRSVGATPTLAAALVLVSDSS